MASDNTRGWRFELKRRPLLTGLPLVSVLKRADAAVTRIPLRDDGLVGTLFVPARPSDQPAVVCLNGAMGGLAEAPAKALAEQGFAALALATHNVAGTPERLRLISLDRIEHAVAWLRVRVEPKNDLVVLRGWSRGGEAALLLASLSPRVNAVIAYAPRCYTGMEQDKPNNFNDPGAVAAWTWRGKPVLGEPLPTHMMRDPSHPSFEDLYGIAVERIAGPIMLVSGGQDTGLAGTTATASCEAAIRRLDLFKSPFRHLHLNYLDAGHTIAGPPPFAGPVEGGGSFEGDAAAVGDSWPRSLAFLREVVQS